MLKRQEPILKPSIAWRLIGLFSLMPIFLAFYIGLNGSIPEDTPRVSLVANCVVLFWGIPFIFYCILFFNKNTWGKGLKKYAHPRIENT